MLAAGRRNEAYMAGVLEAVAALPGVEAVQANALTGSLLIRHPGEWESIQCAAEESGLFAVARQTPLVQEQVNAGLREIGRDLHLISGGSLNLPSTLFLGFTGLAIHQALQGNLLGPASTLLWYALSSLRLEGEGGWYDGK